MAERKQAPGGSAQSADDADGKFFEVSSWLWADSIVIQQGPVAQAS
jgi:hypothetical protein